MILKYIQLVTNLMILLPLNKTVLNSISLSVRMSGLLICSNAKLLMSAIPCLHHHDFLRVELKNLINRDFVLHKIDVNWFSL